MIKQLLTLAMVLCLINGNVAGQARFSIAPVITPMLSSAFFTRTGSLDLYKPYLGYTVGGAAYFHFHPAWAVSAGLGYNQLMVKYPYNNGQQIGLAWSKLRHLQVPVLLHYRSSQKKLASFFSAGMQLEILRRRQFFDGAQILVNSVSNQPEYYLQGLIGAGASYRLSPAFTLQMQPQLSFRPQRVDLTSTPSIKSTLWTFQLGLSTQMLFTF